MTKRVVTFGESLLRLTPPGYERLLQTPRLDVVFGGAESNVAVALASFGMDASYVTALPENNALAEAVIGELRRFGVDTSHIVRGPGRMGLYFLEAGAHQRPSRVLYDREHSAIALAKPYSIDWQRVFDGAGWFHITGITPAISASAAELAMESMQKARGLGLMVSFDLNYRRNLWKWGRSARDVMAEMIPFTDILIGNEEHLRMTLQSGQAAARDLTERALSTYSNLKAVVVTISDSTEASRISSSAHLNDRENFLTSRHYAISPVVDRIGAGDAFAAGLIYGWTQLSTHQEALDFAAAAGCLKHSIPGDQLRSTVEEVAALMRNQNASRVER